MSRPSVPARLMESDPVWVWTENDGTRWLTDRYVVTCEPRVLAVAADVPDGGYRIYAQRGLRPSELPLSGDTAFASRALQAARVRTGWQLVRATAWAWQPEGGSRAARLMWRADGTVVLAHAPLWQAWRAEGTWEHSGTAEHGSGGLFRVTSRRAVTYLAAITNEQIADETGNLAALTATRE